VVEYDEDGQKVGEWGQPGDGPGEFKVLHSIATGPQGNVYVADRENGRLQWFDRHGEFLGQWKYARQLYSVAFNPAGELYISVELPEDAAAAALQSNVIWIDPATGEMLGRVEVFAHELAFAPDGTLLPATRSSELLLFRPRE
jgi:DNA-binding beta-propeller fold protein YncE